VHRPGLYSRGAARTAGGLYRKPDATTNANWGTFASFGFSKLDGSAHYDLDGQHDGT
jgi:hypothetical protein